MLIWISLLGYIIAPIAALIAVWLTSHFAEKRTQNEKIWDRKADAYGTILAALNEMKVWFDVYLVDESRSREPSEAIVEERRVSFGNARKTLRGVVGREAWLLDPAVKERMVEMNKDLDATYDSWFEKLDAGGFAVGNAIEDLTALAGKELRTR
jgi:hypothetical protein